MGGGSEEEHVCMHEEALDVISEFVLVATCIHYDHHDGNHTCNAIQLDIVPTYINAPLRKHIGYDTESSSLPPSGTLKVECKDGKYHGQVNLKISSQEYIF